MASAFRLSLPSTAHLQRLHVCVTSHFCTCALRQGCPCRMAEASAQSAAQRFPAGRQLQAFLFSGFCSKC
eukprot:1160573-Pelagomonas_calceolata.AAC.14